MIKKIYINFNKWVEAKSIGGPHTFMRNLKTYLDKAQYPYTNNFLSGKAMFFPIFDTRPVVMLYKVLGRPIIQRLDGVYYPSKNGDLYVRRNWRMKEVYQKYADFFVFQSDYSRRQCFEMFGEINKDRYAIIVNGVNTGIFYPAGNKIKDKLDKVHFITTGRFRNLDMLVPIIKALDNLKDSLDFKLTIVGSVENEALKEYLDRNYIDFVGSRNMPEVADLLRQADIYLFSSLNPPCPNAVVEAVSSGLPVVAFDDGAMPELVHFSKDLLAYVNDELFKKYEDLDHEKYAEKILLAVEKFPLFKQRALDNCGIYSFDNCIKKYIDVFNKQLDRKAK